MSDFRYLRQLKNEKQKFRYGTLMNNDYYIKNEELNRFQIFMGENHDKW